jgi:hypothetical protein
MGPLGGRLGRAPAPSPRPAGRRPQQPTAATYGCIASTTVWSPSSSGPSCRLKAVKHRRRSTGSTAQRTQCSKGWRAWPLGAGLARAAKTRTATARGPPLGPRPPCPPPRRPSCRPRHARGRPSSSTSGRARRTPPCGSPRRWTHGPTRTPRSATCTSLGKGFRAHGRTWIHGPARGTPGAATFFRAHGPARTPGAATCGSVGSSCCRARPTTHPRPCCLRLRQASRPPGRWWPRCWQPLGRAGGRQAPTRSGTWPPRCPVSSS